MNDIPKRLELTADELKAVERAKASHAELKAKGDYEQYKIYSSPADGVKDLLKGMATTKYYDISSFYKPELVAPAIKNIDIADTISYETAQGDTLEIDQKAIKQKLADNVGILVGFYSNFEGGKLSEKTSKLLDKKTAEGLSKYFELKTVTHKDKDGKSVSITGYVMTDIKALKQAIKSKKPQNFIVYDIVSDTGGTTDISSFTDHFKRLVELANACGIKPSGGVVMHVGNTVVDQTHLQLSRIAINTLASIATGGGKRGSLYTNIPDETLDGVPLPVTDSYQVTLDEITNDPEKVRLLVKERRNKAERGVPIAVQQSLLDAAIADRKPTDIGAITNEGSLSSLGFAEWVTVNDIQQLLKQAGAYALKPALRYLHDNPSGGNVTLTELMYYDENIKTKYPPSKGIPKTTKERFSNSLRLQLMFRYEIPEKTRNRETKLHYINLVKGVPVVDDDTGLITRIEGLDYGADLRIHKLLGVIDHKQADFLPSPEAKLLNDKIQTLMIKGQQQKKTVQGEPLEISVDRLISGVVKSDKNIRVYYSWTAKQLNEYERRGLISKWCTEAGGRDIKASDKSTKKLYISPSEIAKKSYRTPEMYKQEQTKQVEARQAEAELQKYRLGLLKDKHKHYIGTDLGLAQELGIDINDLNSLLSKAKPITQELAEAIRNVNT
jgi:hypothetical protein